MALRPRTFTYAVELDRAENATSDRGGTPIPLEEAWTPEHLLIAGLARCTLKSLRHHARLRGVEVTSRTSANGAVTRRESDGRYAFVEIEVELDVALAPAPDDVRALLARAEHDCFVGASLTIDPVYRWTVNGEEIR